MIADIFGNYYRFEYNIDSISSSVNSGRPKAFRHLIVYQLKMKRTFVKLWDGKIIDESMST